MVTGPAEQVRFGSGVMMGHTESCLSPATRVDMSVRQTRVDSIQNRRIRRSLAGGYLLATDESLAGTTGGL